MGIWIWRLLVLLWSLGIPRVCSETLFTPVNWSLMSPSAIAAAQKALVAPIGCTCVQTSGSTCPFFECPCTCDLTAGACDPFCCCDAECTADHVAAVRNEGLCVDSALIKPSIAYCATNLTLTNVASGHVNLLLADSVLCVAVDNNEVVGDYIVSPAEQDMVVENAFRQNPKSYTFSPSDTVDTLVTQTTYRPGDVIPVFAASASASIYGPKLMGWGPIAGSSRCSRRNPVRFEIEWLETMCVVDELILNDVCEASSSVLDPIASTQSLLVAVNPSVTSAAGGSGNTVAIHVESVQEIDPLTRQTIELATSTPLQPQLVQDSSNETICVGALLGVAYTIYHNGSGLLERVDAVVTIGNISSSAGGPVSIIQSFSAHFVSTATIIRSLDRGNIQSYERAGNPGYVKHRPVRVGMVAMPTSDALKGTSVISEMIGGLALPGLSDCADNGFALPVLFGEDSELSCLLRLNASAFKSFCTRDMPVVDNALRINFSHVARFGNADPFLIDEWLELDYDAPVKTSSTFVDSTGTGTVEIKCKSVLSSLHLEFLVAAVGPVNNPQNKIIAARAFHGREDMWTFWKNPLDPDKEETYLLMTTVSFTLIQTTTLDQWIPPTPPIWFSIPNDVFYPFILSSGTRIVTPPSMWTTVLWIISAVVWTWTV